MLESMLAARGGAGRLTAVASSASWTATRRRRRGPCAVTIPADPVPWCAVRPSVHRRPCGCSSMVEPQSSKLATRVRFSSPAPPPKPPRHLHERRGGFSCSTPSPGVRALRCARARSLPRAHDSVALSVGSFPCSPGPPCSRVRRGWAGEHRPVRAPADHRSAGRAPDRPRPGGPGRRAAGPSPLVGARLDPPRPARARSPACCCSPSSAARSCPGPAAPSSAA